MIFAKSFMKKSDTMKKWAGLFLLLCVLAVSLNTDAVSITAGKSFIKRGEVLTAGGICSPDLETSVQIFAADVLLLESYVSCSDGGSFDFSYHTTFLDPTGKWILAVSDGTETSKTELLVEDAREAGFFFLRFLSPTAGKYARTETISLSIEVTDSGEKVNDANLAFYGFDGKRYLLKGAGNGVYVSDYEIPADAALGSWNLEVFAESQRSEGKAGGRNRIPIQVDVPPIKIQVIEPSVNTFEFGDEVKIKLIATYFNGKSLKGATASAMMNNTEVRLIMTADNTFEGKFTAPSTQSGTLALVMQAEDQAGNKGTQVSKLVIGCSVTCLAKNYGLFALLAIVIVVAIGSIVLTKLSSSNQLSKLKEERQKTLDMIKSLQEDYFTKGVMPSSSYKKNLSDYTAKVAELEEKIAQLKSKKEQE